MQYQINIVSTTVSPFVENAIGIFGKVKNEVFLNGILVITWVDEKTWFANSGFIINAWDFGGYIDDIKISNDISKYRPTGPVTLVQDSVVGVSSILSSIIANSSNGTTKSSVGVTDSQSGNTNSLQSDAITGTSGQNDSGTISSNTSNTASETNNPKVPNKGSPLYIIILIIAIVLILGAGGAIYFFVLRKPKV